MIRGERLGLSYTAVRLLLPFTFEGVRFRFGGVIVIWGQELPPYRQAYTFRRFALDFGVDSATAEA